MIVMRIVEANGSRALRIVDVLGEEETLKNSGWRLEQAMRDYGCEYVDMYEYGISEEVLHGLGMKEVKEGSGVVIPNYFEPFEQRNVELYFFTNHMDRFRMLKADGDQERPNRRP